MACRFLLVSAADAASAKVNSLASRAFQGRGDLAQIAHQRASLLGVLSPTRPAGATLAFPLSGEGGAALGFTITPVLVLLIDLVAAALAGDCPYDGELEELFVLEGEGTAFRSLGPFSRVVGFAIPVPVAAPLPFPPVELLVAAAPPPVEPPPPPAAPPPLPPPPPPPPPP